MVGWHHQLSEHEFDQTLGDSDGQGSLVCCSPWGSNESDTTEQLNNNIFSSMYILSHFSRVRLFAALWTVAHQALLSMGSSRQEYWSGLPCPPPGDLPDPGLGHVSLTSPALAGGFFTMSTPWEAHIQQYIFQFQEVLYNLI